MGGKRRRAPRPGRGIGRWTAGGLLLVALAPAMGWLLLAERSGAQQAPGTGPAVDAAGAGVREVYAKYCAQCHGDSGDGRGIAAPYLRPAPRDFTSGKYQVRSTPTGALPTDDDLRRVIREGIPYTGMPGFPGLTNRQVDELVQYLKTFSRRFEAGQAPEPLELSPTPGSRRTVSRRRARSTSRSAAPVATGRRGAATGRPRRRCATTGGRRSVPPT
jgi:mono/diheme cytochrome c family protein